MKNDLAKADLMMKLFFLLDEQLLKRGVLLHQGRMVEALVVEVPQQSDTRDENMKIRQGVVPEGC